MSGILGGAGSKSGVIGKTIALNPYTLTPGDSSHGTSRTFSNLPSWATTFHIIFYPAGGSTFSGSTAGPSSEGSDHIRVRFNGSTSNHQGYNQNNQNTTGQGGGIECYVGSSGRQLYGSINVIKFSPTQYIFNTNDLFMVT